MRRFQNTRPHRLQIGAALLCLAAAAPGCQREKPQQDGKTYTSSQGSAQGGGSSSSSGGDSSSGKQPLDAPADTVNGRQSQASDNGSTGAANGQVVANPGAPNARNSKADGTTPPSKKAGGAGH